MSGFDVSEITSSSSWQLVAVVVVSMMQLLLVLKTMLGARSSCVNGEEMASLPMPKCHAPITAGPLNVFGLGFTSATKRTYQNKAASKLPVSVPKFVPVCSREINLIPEEEDLQPTSAPEPENITPVGQEPKEVATTCEEKNTSPEQNMASIKTSEDKPYVAKKGKKKGAAKETQGADDAAQAPPKEPQTASMTPAQKACFSEVRKIQKKLREVTDLKKRMEEGETLTASQQAKVSAEPDLQNQLQQAEAAYEESLQVKEPEEKKEEEEEEEEEEAGDEQQNSVEQAEPAKQDQQQEKQQESQIQGTEDQEQDQVPQEDGQLVEQENNKEDQEREESQSSSVDSA